MAGSRNVAGKGNPFASGVGRATITVGAETGGNTKNVAIRLADAQNNATGGRLAVRGYLSDHATGQSLTGTAPSSGIAIGTNGLLIEVVDNKVFELITNASGLADINLVEASTGTWYLVLIMPDGTLAISGAITFA